MVWLELTESSPPAPAPAAPFASPLPPPPTTPTPGPNDRKLGKQYVGDPTVDETQLLLGQYSLLQWVERFPHWKLTGERPGGADCRRV